MDQTSSISPARAALLISFRETAQERGVTWYKRAMQGAGLDASRRSFTALTDAQLQAATAAE